MKRVSEFLFYVWLLSLPFYRFGIVGTLSFDQILGPVLVVLWVVMRPAADMAFSAVYTRNVVTGMLLLFLYFLSHHLGLVLSQSAIWRYIYRFLTDVPYFLVPLLYIRSALIRRRAEDAVMVVALMGALTSFMVAYGLLQLPVARESADRLAIEGLNLTRATGLIGAFGDMAILTAFSLMTVLSPKRETLLFMRRNSLVAVGIVLALLLGFVGSQSRNIAITVMVSMPLYLMIGLWARRGIDWIPRFYPLLFMGMALVAIALGFFFEPLFELVASVGGKSARGTAMGRLEQYALGMQLLDGRYVLGAPPAAQERYEVFINSIHNMWIKEFVIGGMLAVLAMLGFLIAGMIRATRCLRVDPMNLPARIRLVLCVTLLISTQFNPSGTSIFWLIVGMILANCCGHETAPVRAAPRVRVHATAR